MRSRSKTIELCLCRRCLSAFYATKRYWIERVDPYERIREPCTFCQIGMLDGSLYTMAKDKKFNDKILSIMEKVV